MRASYTVACLHAIPHDAWDFNYEYSEKWSGNSFVLPCPKTNLYLGHGAGIVFCLYLKTFKNRFFNRLECWQQDWLFLTLKVFEAQKSVFIVKELAITCNNCTDTIFFSPPHSNNKGTFSEQKSYQWVLKYLYGLDWEKGDYPYFYLQQILQSVVLRFPPSDFHAKKVEKTNTLQSCFREK